MSAALSFLSVIIPARNDIEHEIVVVDDGSTDSTWEMLDQASQRVPTLRAIKNTGEHGFGRAVVFGFDNSRGDAVVVMMADESDDCRDVVRYWKVLNEGTDAVFGSRFIRGGGVIDYPFHKLLINRLANLFLRLLFGVRVNDFTNAFKAYRRRVIDGCRPFLAPHFNLTVELPLKTIVRGYTWTVVPVTWRNRRTGISKLKIKEMGSRYLFIALYCWLEKHFSREDYGNPERGAKKDTAPPKP
jgi:dolichol-phosphate mannosyltransferase